MIVQDQTPFAGWPVRSIIGIWYIKDGIKYTLRENGFEEAEVDERYLGL